MLLQHKLHVLLERGMYLESKWQPWSYGDIVKHWCILVIFYIIITTLAHMVYAQEFNFLSFIFFAVLKICHISKKEYSQLKNLIKLSFSAAEIIRKMNLCINILFTLMSSQYIVTALPCCYWELHMQKSSRIKLSWADN